MALTPQEAQALNAKIDEVQAGVNEIKEVVQNSLAIKNVGGGHVFNLALNLEPKVNALKASVAELEE